MNRESSAVLAQSQPSAVLRPRQAADYIGTSLSSFWRFVKNDPAFPRPFKLGENTTVLRRADLDAWLNAKQEAAQ